MNAHELRAKRAIPTARRVREARLTVLVVAATVVALGAVLLIGRGDDPEGAAGNGAPIAVAAGQASTATTAVDAPTPSVDLAEPTADDCVIEATRLALDDSGAEETFWVYDHPEVRIFRRSENLSEEEFRSRLCDPMPRPAACAPAA